MRTYTQEEKQAVIDRVISGEPSAHILADTGIPKNTFYSLLRIYQEEQNAANRKILHSITYLSTCMHSLQRYRSRIFRAA